MNETIFFFFYSLAHKSSFFDWLIIFLAEFLPYIVIILAFVFLIYHHEILPGENPLKEFRKKWKEIFSAFLSSISAWILANLLKYFFQASRPQDLFPDVVSLIQKADYAFPSGHSTFFMALAVSIFFSHKKAGYLFIFFALLIGLSRIAAGVHSPVDILGGFILGIVIAFLFKNV